MSRGRSVSFHLGASSAAASVDGNDSVTARSTATFSAVSANHYASASFASARDSLGENRSSTNHHSSTSFASARDSLGVNYGASSVLYGAGSKTGMSSFRQTRLFQRGSVQDADDGTTANESHQSIPRRRGDSPSSRTTTSRTRFTRLSAVRPTLPCRLRRGREAPTPRHVVCAISENLARETCVTSMDTHAPSSTLSASRQGNGQAYAETLACLRVLQPDEILLNEGRRTSQLVRKVLEMYRHDPDDPQPVDWMMDEPPPNNTKRGSKRPRNRSGPIDPQASVMGKSDDAESLASIPSGAAPLLGRDEGATRTVVKFVSRGLFDQTRGAAMLRQLARHDTYDPTLLEEYILLSSAHAVIAYSQMALGATFAPHSLQLFLSAGACDDGERFRSLSNSRMMIDRTTQWQLELLVNSKTGKAQPSLMATIDKTKTAVGSRLLRANLMAPPTRIDTIEARLELVDTFLQSSDFFFDVQEHLMNLPDVDKMMTNITLVPQGLGTVSNEEHLSEKLVRLASKGIASLVSIKAVLSTVPHLAATLQSHLTILEGESAVNPSQPGDDDDGTAARSSLLVGLGAATPAATPDSGSGGNLAPHRNHLLRAVVCVLQQPQLAILLDLVTTIYTESTTYARNANSRQHQECFALKDESENGLLTILRRAYVENVNEIYAAADAMAARHDLPVTVRYSASKGYCLSIPATACATTDLPPDLLHPVRSGRAIVFETTQVASLNGRVQENVRDLLGITHERIEQVLEQARGPVYYDALAALCDAVSLLDLCHSFADVVSLSTLPWCRPMVFDDSSGDGDAARATSLRASVGPALQRGGFIIRSGRYPIDVATVTTTESLGEGGAFQYVPNDTFVADQKTFTVVTGVNGAGKTTYLKQVAIIAILAQIGCYVPAEQASLPLFDRICTRIGNADDQEHNISTFMLEMKETAFICSNATAKSLILLDELGRATSNEDGVAIAWAVSEYLMTRQSTVFFVTHYPQLTKLAQVYPSLVQNIHLEADLKRDESGNQLLYTHKVKSGSCDVSSEYGVELAAYCGWTHDVLHHARAHEAHARSLLPDDSFCRIHEASARSRAYTNVLELVCELKSLGEVGGGIQSFTGLREILATAQGSAQDAFLTDPDLKAEFFNLLRISSPISLPHPVWRASGSSNGEGVGQRATTESAKENRREELSLLLSPQMEGTRSCRSASSVSRSSPSGSSLSSASSASSSKSTVADAEIEPVSSEVVARARNYQL